jgi:hypothetical protein
MDTTERLDALSDAWRERCPIELALLQSNDISVSVAVEPGGTPA